MPENEIEVALQQLPSIDATSALRIGDEPLAGYPTEAYSHKERN
jgi:hypothetical protein